MINFQQHNFPVNELYNANEILKIKDYIHLINFLFVKDVLSNESLEASQISLQNLMSFMII